MAVTGVTGALWCFAVALLLTDSFALGNEPFLEILPLHIQHKPIGRPLLLTCRPVVDDPDLISNIEWSDPQNRIITHDSSKAMYAERMDGGKLGLMINKLTENMAGDYLCSAVYGSNQKLTANVTIRTFLPIEWVDAKEYQYAIKGEDAVVKCEVKARPAPTLDWLRNGKDIRSNDKYIVETKGLRIKNVQDTDDGVYVCRAIVTSTGEYSVKNIRLEVLSRPVIESLEKYKEVNEGEIATISCKAEGKPTPSYKWIKENSFEDLDKADRFTVDHVSGLLTMRKIEGEDSGPFTCVATNSAGENRSTVQVSVIVKPKIYELLNVTTEIETETKLVCKASGRPAPEMYFKKQGTTTPFVKGTQINDNRIIYDQEMNEEKGETYGTLTIMNAKRSDDGLYECAATNKGGEAFKNGHVTIEFIPTFEHILNHPPTYTWDQRRVNLTCIAESIPNATIEWRVRGRTLEENNFIHVIGRNAISYLEINPVDQQYYSVYTCNAKNKLGEANIDLELRLGQRPKAVQESKLQSITATSISFQLIGPGEEAGLPIRAFLVQYKDARESDWNRATNKTWSVKSLYSIEKLLPLVTYDFRFAAKNDVGLGSWGGGQKYTMPNRGPPEPPKLLVMEVNEAGAIESPYSDHFEVRWKIPSDNGELVDIYELTYCPIYKENGEWKTESNDICLTEEIRATENTAHELRKLVSDTYYQVKVRAHNKIGYSSFEEMIIKTARGSDGPWFHHGEPVLSSGSIIGIVIAGVILMVILVDLLLCGCRRQGVFATICYKKSKQHEEDEAKLGSLYGWRFPLPYCSNKEPPAPPSPAPLPPPVKLASTPTDEKEPLKDNRDNMIINNSMMRNTSVEFDGRRVHAKTGDIIGKNSAV